MKVHAKSTQLLTSDVSAVLSQSYKLAFSVTNKDYLGTKINLGNWLQTLDVTNRDLN